MAHLASFDFLSTSE